MSRIIRFVSDVHGDMNVYFSIIKNIKESIQIGDMGVAATKGWVSAEYLDYLYENLEPKGRHRWINGNHDSLQECVKSKHFIRSGIVKDNMMFIGGALSIDKAYRTPGIDWWEDEELSYEELHKLIDKYEKIKPNIVISHDCPTFIKNHFVLPAINGSYNYPCRTDYALEEMRHIHQPKLHIFGHYHTSLDFEFCDTRYICLPINGYIDIDVDNL